MSFSPFCKIYMTLLNVFNKKNMAATIGRDDLVDALAKQIYSYFESPSFVGRWVGRGWLVGLS